MSEFKKALDDLRRYGHHSWLGTSFPLLNGVLDRLLSAEPPREMTEAELALKRSIGEGPDWTKEQIRSYAGHIAVWFNAVLAERRPKPRKVADVTAELKEELESDTCRSGAVHRLSEELLSLLEGAK
jgi:hypothetical protein